MLRGTLDDEAGSAGVVSEGVGDSHELALGAEGDPELEGNSLGFTLNEFLLDVDTVGEEEVEEADFNGAASRLVGNTSHLHVSVTVEDNAFVKGAEDLHLSFNAIGIVGGAGDVQPGDGHITGGEGGGLSSDDVAELAGGLKGIEVLDEEVLGLELVN